MVENIALFVFKHNTTLDYKLREGYAKKPLESIVYDILVAEIKFLHSSNGLAVSKSYLDSVTGPWSGCSSQQVQSADPYAVRGA